MVKLTGSTLVTLAFLPSSCLSFMPNKIAGTWTPGNTRTHAKQTEDEINNFIMNHWGVKYDTGFTSTMKKARSAIIDANANVDDGDEKNIGYCHFDDELFSTGQQHLMNLREEMIGFLQQENPDADSARKDLGRQLHGLQDFYAHSNWVESGNMDTSKTIGWPGQNGYAASDPNVTTCSNYCENPQTTDYLSDLTCLDNCKSGDAHWWQLASQTICVNIHPFSCNLPDCSANLVPEFTGVTSGYYLVIDNPGSVKPPGKCTHGGLNDAGAKGTEGINKDSEWPLYAPHGLIPISGWGPGANGHQVAATLSQSATQDYLGQLAVDYSAQSMPALTESQLKNLFGIGSSPLVFVVDCTGSMSDIISALEIRLSEIVNTLNGTQDQPLSYTLTCYNDPDTLNVMTTTTDSSTFLSDLGTLYASGGGDCPEPALSALMETISSIDPFSNVFLFTDAQDKDPELFDDVVHAAVAKNIHLYFFLFPSSCSDGSSYGALAEATTGKFVPMPDRSGTEDLVTMALQLIDPDLVNTYGDYPIPSSGTAFAKRDSSSVSVLVDSTMTSIIFDSAGSSALTIARPDGTIAQPTDSGVSYFSNAATTFVTINSPQPGTWTAQRSSSTDGTSLQVQAISKLTFIDFSFVEIRGHHPGYFPINETLVSGTVYTVTADIEGTQDIDHFEFRSSKNGQVLTKFAMNRLNDSAGSSPEHIWVNNVTVPCGTFYAYALGRDPSGFPFQRMYPNVLNTTASCNVSIPAGVGNVTFSAPGNDTLSGVNSTLTAGPPSTYGNWTFASTAMTSTPTGTATLSTTGTYPSCSACVSNGQGVPMTRTVVVLSTVTICPYVSTASGCTGDGSCEISTHSLSTVPYATTTVLVPIPGATPSFKTREGARGTTKCNFDVEFKAGTTWAFTPTVSSATEMTVVPVSGAAKSGSGGISSPAGPISSGTPVTNVAYVPGASVSAVDTVTSPVSPASYTPHASIVNGTVPAAGTGKGSPTPSVAVNATMQQFQGTAPGRQVSWLALLVEILFAFGMGLVNV